MIRSLVVVVVLAGAAHAAQSIEGVKAQAGLGFGAPALKASFRAQRHVSLNGSVSLSGNGFVPQNGGFVSVPLSGTVRVSGDGVTGDGSVHEYASVWVREGSNYVSQFVHVNTSVSLYKGGRFVGTAMVSGSVLVSGWANGSWLWLNGSGSMTGSAFIPDDAKKN